MLSCKKTTELIEKESIVGLSSREKFRLRLHVSMCDGCTAYLKQSLFIDKALARHIIEISPLANPQNEILQNRILSKLTDK